MKEDGSESEALLKEEDEDDRHGHRHGHSHGGGANCAPGRGGGDPDDVVDGTVPSTSSAGVSHHDDRPPDHPEDATDDPLGSHQVEVSVHMTLCSGGKFKTPIELQCFHK